MARREVRTAGRTDGRTAFGPGFVASAILLGAVLLCGVLLVVTGSGVSPLPRATGAASPPLPTPVGTPPAVATAPGSPEPAETAGSSESAPSRVPAPAGGCGPASTSDAVPRSAPPGAEWVVYRRTVVPHHPAAGPARTDADGFRHCFAHSPTGALYAAYTAIASLSDTATLTATTKRLLLPGADRDRLLASTPPDQAEPVELAGFRVVDASRDRFTVALAMRVGELLASGTFTMVWYDSDWRLLPPGPGQRLGAPYAQLRDLGGFVPWSGLR